MWGRAWDLWGSASAPGANLSGIGLLSLVLSVFLDCLSRMEHQIDRDIRLCDLIEDLSRLSTFEIGRAHV